MTLYQKVIRGTVTYVFTDTPSLGKRSPYFFIKNDLKLLKEKALEMLPKYRRIEGQSWP